MAVRSAPLITTTNAFARIDIAGEEISGVAAIAALN
jgi:hypothetical protein